MKTLAAACAALLAVCSCPAAHAGSAGAEPLGFLLLDANARAVGLAGAYSALANDANALLYNPAGLGRVRRSQVTFMHNQYFQGVSQEYVAAAFRQGWGGQLNVLNSGAIQQTTYADPAGAGLGSAGLSDLAISGGYGRALSDDLSLGAGLKFIREAIAGASAQGFGLDVGALYHAPRIEGLSLGLAAQNLGPGVKFEGESESLPLNVRLGSAYAFTVKGQGGILSLDLLKERSEGMAVAFGAELTIAKAMPVRFGFTTKNQAGPGVAAGFGWVHKAFAVDYAVTPYGELGMAHRVSLTWSWGRAAGEPESTGRAMPPEAWRPAGQAKSDSATGGRRRPTRR